jgi:hypothetical protein
MRRRPIPWRPLRHPRPSFALFWLRGRRSLKRERWAGARRHTQLVFPDLAFYPESTPPVMKFERTEGCLHWIVMRGTLARLARRPA